MPHAPDPITILLPARNQKREFFFDAVASVQRQTCPDWRLLILLASDSDEMIEWADSIQDSRVRYLIETEPGFAGALNLGMREAESEFVSLLLSDDRHAPEAVSTLQHYRRNHPDADFFYSARRYIDVRGETIGGVHPDRGPVSREQFLTRGSPVKHLLCWRRAMALQIGGMDPDLSRHGCDDYDFPWRMLEAGCRFQAVAECLYEYRLHGEASRLTTSVTVNEQIEILQRMFRKHHATEPQISGFLQRAVKGYLVRSQQRVSDEEAVHAVCYSEGVSYQVYRLPRPGRDGLRLAIALLNCSDLTKMREITLRARNSALDRPNLLEAEASASIVADGDIVWALSLRFDGVHDAALFNALIDYAVDVGAKTLYSPALQTVTQLAGSASTPTPEFEGAYDELPRRLFMAELEGRWWRTGIESQRERALLTKKARRLPNADKTICLFHDTERGAGHLASDPAFASEIEKPSAEALERILAVEAAAGIKVTYNVLGLIWPDVAPLIAAQGHVLAFHSYDHQVEGLSAEAVDAQLTQCRALDQRPIGYRPPQSRMEGLDPRTLCLHNIEWLATSRSRVSSDVPYLGQGFVKIPIHLDDYDLYRQKLSYFEWEAAALDLVDKLDFVAIGLHDCYFRWWLPNYAGFIEKLKRRGRLRTFDEVSDAVMLASAGWL